MKRRFICVAILVALLSAWITPVEAETGSSVGFDAEALDVYISGQMSKHGIQGISLAVTSKTEIIYLKGYGTAGDDRPITPQTPMYIGCRANHLPGWRSHS